MLRTLSPRPGLGLSAGSWSATGLQPLFLLPDPELPWGVVSGLCWEGGLGHERGQTWASLFALCF